MLAVLRLVSQDKRKAGCLLLARFAVLTTVSLTGCIRTHTLNEVEWDAMLSRAEAVRLENGRVVSAESARRQKSPVSAVVEINHGRGALQGMGNGAGIGAAILGTTGWFLSSAECTDFCLLDKKDTAGLGVVFGAVLGAILGVGPGIMSGSRTEYTLETPSVYVLPKSKGGLTGIGIRF